MTPEEIFKLTPSDAVLGSAVFSPCRQYRYDLWRKWRDTNVYVMFVGGPDNDRTLTTLAQGAAIIVAAWGKDGKFRGRDREVMALFPCLYTLKQNKDGSPAHPLYLRGDATPYPLNSK